MKGVVAAVALFLAPFCLVAADDSNAVPSSGSSPAGKLLIDFTSPDAEAQVKAIEGNPQGSVVRVDEKGISVDIPGKPGKVDHAGLRVFPPKGEKFWDLSAYGHVEARITNTSPDKSFDIVMHVVDDEDEFWRERKTEFVTFKPGQTRVLKVIFGYQYGFKPGPPLKASRVDEIYFFMWGGNPIDRPFRIEELKAAGVAGEKPVANPSSVSNP